MIKMNPAMVIFKVQSFGNTLVQSYNYVHSKILHIEQACVYEVCKNLKKHVYQSASDRECFRWSFLSRWIYQFDFVSALLVELIFFPLGIIFNFTIWTWRQRLKNELFASIIWNFMSLGSDCILSKLNE